MHVALRNGRCRDGRRALGSEGGVGAPLEGPVALRGAGALLYAQRDLRIELRKFRAISRDPKRLAI